MGKKFYKEFLVSAPAGRTILDKIGILGTEEEPKIVTGIIISFFYPYLAVAEIWKNGIKQMDIHNLVIDTKHHTGTTFTMHSIEKLPRVPLNYTLEKGDILRVGITSGAYANTICGAYEYEIIVV